LSNSHQNILAISGALITITLIVLYWYVVKRNTDENDNKIIDECDDENEHNENYMDN